MKSLLFKNRTARLALAGLASITLSGWISCAKENLSLAAGPELDTIEDLLMPNAVVLARGTLSNAVVDLNAILNDTSLAAQQVQGCAVWRRPLADLNPNPFDLRLVSEPYPNTVQLSFALSPTGAFFFGAEGPVADVLSVMGTLFWGNSWDRDLWDSVACPNEWSKDEGIYEPKDVGLVGMGWRELKKLPSNELSGVPPLDYDFRIASSIRVKHKLQKPVWIFYYPIFIVRGNEGGDWAAGFPMNARWSQFASVFASGQATRSVQVAYEGPVASYIYSALFNNDWEDSWMSLDGAEVHHLYDWGVDIRKIYNSYPTNIALGALKLWSYVTPAVTMTILADSLTLTNWTEDPSLGARRNPPPDLLKLPPNMWLPAGAPVITTQPQTPAFEEGQTLSLWVEASGTEPISYQWYKAGAVLSNADRVMGSMTTNLMLLGAQSRDAGDYWVIVADSQGSVTSAVARVQINQGNGAPGTSILGQTVQGHQAELFWTVPTPGATWYHLWLSRNGTKYSEEWIEGRTNAVYELPAGTYSSWLQGCNSKGYGSWSGACSFIVLTNLPCTPVLLNPTGAITIDNPRPLFSWGQTGTNCSGAIWYCLWINRNGATYTNFWIQNTDTWTPANDLPPGGYAWWVQPWNIDGLGKWSATGEFTITLPAAGRLTPISPSGANTLSSTLRYTWTADPYATWYRVCIYTNGTAFSDKWYPLANLVSVASNQLALDKSGHRAGNYTWWVQGWSPGGLGPWSTGMTFNLLSGAPAKSILLAPE